MTDDNAMKVSRKPLMGKRARRSLLKHVLLGESVDEALAACGSNRWQLANTRKADANFDTELACAMSQAVEIALYEGATKGGKISSQREFLHNRSSGMYQPDLSLALSAKARAEQRPRGDAMRPRRLIFHRPATMPGPDQVIDIAIGPRQLPEGIPADDGLPIDVEEGELVETPTPAEQLVEAPTRADQGHEES